MNKPLFLFVGRSASGKSTIADLLVKQYAYKQVWSYTTRKPRYDGEPNHIFISKEEFNNLGELAAYTLYNGNEYGLISATDLAKISNRPIRIIYFDASVVTCIDRMIDRHSSDMEIVSRLHNDHEFDWKDRLDKAVWHYNKNLNKNIELYTVNANLSISVVLDQVLYYMQDFTEV